MEEIDAGTTASLIAEAGASVSDAPPAPVPEPQAPETNLTADPESSPPSGEGTAYSEKMSMMEGVIPTAPDRDTYEAVSAPGWGQSTAWAIDEYGVTANVVRGLDSFMSEPETGDPLKIQQNLTDLMVGVPAEYEAFISTQRTYENAETQSERLRTINRRDSFRANEGLGQALTTGVAGFVLDPTNLVPGAILLKGMGMSAKLSMAAGLRGAASTTVTRQAAVWGGFGVAEELVRASPRLATDETYKIQEYYLDAGMGLAFGAGGTVVGAGFKGFKNGAWIQDFAETKAGLAVDRAFRQTVNTAEALGEQSAEATGVMNKVAAMDVGEAVRDAGEKTKQQMDDKVHDVDRKSFMNDVKKAIMDSDIGATAEATTAFFGRVGDAIAARATNPSAGAAGRTTNLMDMLGDIGADISYELRMELKLLQTKMDEVVDFGSKAMDVADAASDAAQKKASEAIDAANEALKTATDSVQQNGLRETIRKAEAEIAEAIRVRTQKVRDIQDNIKHQIDVAFVGSGVNKLDPVRRVRLADGRILTFNTAEQHTDWVRKALIHDKKLLDQHIQPHMKWVDIPGIDPLKATTAAERQAAKNRPETADEAARRVFNETIEQGGYFNDGEGAGFRNTPEQDKARVDEVNARFQEAMDKLKKAQEDGVNPINGEPSKPKTENNGDAGAAKRKPAPGQKMDDLVNDARYEARMALKAINDAADVALKYLDEVDLSASARKELDFAIRAGREAAIDAANAVAALKGVRPQRTRLSNKQATTEVTKALYRAQKAIAAAFDGIDSSLLPDGVSMPVRYRAAINKAYAKAGIKRKDGETLEEAFEREMGGKSSKMRDATLAVMIQEVDIQINAMKQDLDALEGIVVTDELIAAIENARVYADSQLDFVRMLSSNPYTDALVTTVQWAEVSANWRAQGNMDELGRQFVDSKIQTGVKNQYGRLSESLSSKMMKTGAPLAQWFTHTILEVPSGYGGQIDRNPLTAAIYSENLFNAAKFPVAKSWEDLMKETAIAEGWGVMQRMANTAGNAKTHKDVARLSQDVMLEMNARQQGLESKASPAVKKFVDQLDRSYQELHDLQNGHVDGIHAGNKIKNYQHQAWNDTEIIQMIGTPDGRANMERLFEVGYIKAGMDEGKAKVLAKAMIDQKATAAARPKAEIINIGDEELRGSMPQLLEIVERMRKNGDSEQMIQEIVEELNRAAGGETPTYAKSRTPIDLSASITVDGKVIRIVDLMDQDVPATFIRYAKEATGRRAISESSNGMLRSDADMNGMLTAMALESQEIGANVDTRSARIALQQMMGKSYEGQLPMNARRVRDGVSLAGMGGLGESQLAEFGLALNRGTAGLVGAMQKFGNVKARLNQFRGLELTPAQATNREYLSDLQEISGLYQDMYLIDRQNVHFDAAETNTNELGKLVDTATGGKYRPMLQRMQGKFTGYGAIRQMEDQVAMASLMHDLAKHLDPNREAFTSLERLRDLGVPTGKDSWLGKLFDEHVSFKDDGTIETLNLNQWSSVDKAKLGVILNRYASQQVQKGFIGESSPAMMNQWVAFMMQFKSYPMLAAEKQQARHLKFADKEAAMGIMLNTVSSAMARVIRYQSMALSITDEEQRKRYLSSKYENLGKDTFAYMGIAGMSASMYETAKGVSGNGDYNYSIANEMPVLNYIDGVTKALQDPLKKDSNGRVARNTQNAAPLGTTAQGNILFRIMSEMTPDGSDNE